MPAHGPLKEPAEASISRRCSTATITRKLLGAELANAVASRDFPRGGTFEAAGETQVLRPQSTDAPRTLQRAFHSSVPSTRAKRSENHRRESSDNCQPPRHPGTA